jgi:hypothetical protein
MNRRRKQIRNLRKPALAIASAALGMALGLSASAAQNAPASAESSSNAGPQAAIAGAPKTGAPQGAPHVGVAKPYYIEFRSRSAQSYGHTFSIYGRLNGQGKIASKTVAGLHPFTESALPWMVGHLVVVPSETGASDGDTEDQYVTARFRVALNQDEYKKVTGFVKELQKKSPLWHAVLYNCNAFVGDIARFMGMETPASTMLMPADYINSLRDLNISRVNVAGVIGTPVKVADAAKLRAEALKAVARSEKSASKERRESGSSKPEAAGASTAPAPGRHRNATPVSVNQSRSPHEVAGDISRPSLSPTSN